jgi:hypothetical protein
VRLSMLIDILAVRKYRNISNETGIDIKIQFFRFPIMHLYKKNKTIHTYNTAYTHYTT